MASNNFAIVDIDKADDELQFQDFGLSSSNGRASNSQTHYFSSFPDSPGHQTDAQKLLGEYRDDEEEEGRPRGPAQGKEPSLWTLEYYQRYFDVDTKQVCDRIMWSMVPKPGISFLELHVKPKPDLYGPFWICLTLVFTAAVTGNIFNYMQTAAKEYWRYDFHKVSLAAGVVFSYGWLVPLVLYCVLRFRSPRPPLSLLHLICLYGYSLSVFVPICIVWAVPVYWLWWCVGIVGVVLSGVVLCKAVWEGLRSGNVSMDEEDPEEVVSVHSSLRNVAVVMVAVVAVLHVTVAVVLMMYFFSLPGGAQLQAAGNSSLVTDAVASKNASLAAAAAGALQSNAEAVQAVQLPVADSAKQAAQGDTGGAQSAEKVGDVAKKDDRSSKLTRSLETGKLTLLEEGNSKAGAVLSGSADSVQEKAAGAPGKANALPSKQGVIATKANVPPNVDTAEVKTAAARANDGQPDKPGAEQRLSEGSKDAQPVSVAGQSPLSRRAANAVRRR